MNVEERRAAREGFAGRRRPALIGVSGKEGRAEEGPGNGCPVQAPGHRPVLGGRFGAFLRALADALGRVAFRIQTVDGVEAIGEGPRTPVEAGAELSPGRRDEPLFDVRPQSAQERGRLVQLVDEAHRNEHEAGPRSQRPGEEIIEVGELHLHLSPLVRRRDRVLRLDLCIQDPVSVELVAEIEDRAREVRLVPGARWLAVLAAAGEILVQELAVSSERDTLPRVDLRSRGSDAIAEVFGLG